MTYLYPLSYYHWQLNGEKSILTRKGDVDVDRQREAVRRRDAQTRRQPAEGRFRLEVVEVAAARGGAEAAAFDKGSEKSFHKVS